MGPYTKKNTHRLDIDQRTVIHSTLNRYRNKSDSYQPTYSLAHYAEE